MSVDFGVRAGHSTFSETSLVVQPLLLSGPYGVWHKQKNCFRGPYGINDDCSLLAAGGAGCMGMLVASCPHAPRLSAAISSASCAAAAAAFTAAGFHCVLLSPPGALVKPWVWRGSGVTEWDFDGAIMRDPAIIQCSWKEEK